MASAFSSRTLSLKGADCRPETLSEGLLNASSRCSASAVDLVCELSILGNEAAQISELDTCVHL